MDLLIYFIEEIIGRNDVDGQVRSNREMAFAEGLGNSDPIEAYEGSVGAANKLRIVGEALVPRPLRINPSEPLCPTVLTEPAYASPAT